MKVRRPAGSRLKRLLMLVNALLLLAIVVNGTFGALDARSYAARTCGQGDMWAGVAITFVALVPLTALVTTAVVWSNQFRINGRVAMLVLGDVLLTALALASAFLIRQWEYTSCL